MRFVILAFAVAALGAAPAQAKGDQEAIATVRSALDRGHGQSCSLSAEPVARGGYYPCLDIGPYRFVAEYGRMRGFVLIEGQPPFPILHAESGQVEFLVRGPWQDDLAERVSAWWEDEVSGGRARREAQEQGTKRQSDAEKAVRRFTNPSPAPISEPAAPQQFVPPPVGVVGAPARRQSSAPSAPLPGGPIALRDLPGGPAQPPSRQDLGGVSDPRF
ncbi:hypothetical protein [Bosea sp. ANAM02]|uniref:hypothetical protein n=1 Tax=Bosea sp. ANAM02 TaxID=2020412 RepID=UPI00140F4B90|nr:hypothetical protein [Bosea sp. ANAM02]BCB22505.1 hypothetical protein OCUBac02_53990 [Bosea sp. ANAM02]